MDFDGLIYMWIMWVYTWKKDNRPTHLGRGRSPYYITLKSSVATLVQTKLHTLSLSLSILFTAGVIP